MTSFGQISYKQVKRMLKKCAPGHTIEDKKHLKWIRFQEKIARIPRGPHGKRRHFDIEVGHIRNMARLFKIENCARTMLPQL